MNEVNHLQISGLSFTEIISRNFIWQEEISSLQILNFIWNKQTKKKNNFLRLIFLWFHLGFKKKNIYIYEILYISI